MRNVPFADTCSIVTGASAGIGRALAVELSKGRARLALIGRRPDELDRTRRACLEAGATRVETWNRDLGNVSAIESLVGDIEQRMGEVPGLAVHAAGLLLLARVEDYPLEDATELINVNLLAGFALARALVPRMRAKGGTIGFISSGTAYRAVPFQWAYSASKAGIERLAEALRVELSGSPVRVRVVSPGPVGTGMSKSPRAIGGASLLGLPKSLPTAEEVAPAILAGFASRHPRTERTMHVRLIRWLSAFGAEPFDTILRRRL